MALGRPHDARESLQLPFVLVFNKTDICDHHFATEWMTDFDAFQVSEATPFVARCNAAAV